MAQGDFGALVKVFSGSGTSVLQEFKVGPNSYQRGVFVAAGDVNGDGKADIMAGRDLGSPPVVEAFSGADGSLLKSVVAFDASFRLGVRVAATDVNLDGIADIIAVAGRKGGSQGKIFDGKTGEQIRSFTAFPSFPDVALFVAGSTPFVHRT